MDIFLTWLKALFEWFRAPVKIMSAIAILSAIALFLPPHLQSVMGVAEWTEKHRLEEWMSFLFAAIWVAISGVQSAFYRAKMWRTLQHLPKDKKLVLRFYVEQNLSTHSWLAATPAASALEDDGILLPLRSHDVTRKDGYFYYKVRPWVLRYLTKRPKLVAD